MIVSNEKSVYTQIGFENMRRRQYAGVRALPRKRQRDRGSKGVYEVKTFNHGLILQGARHIGRDPARVGKRALSRPAAAGSPSDPRLPPTSHG